MQVDAVPPRTPKKKGKEISTLYQTHVRADETVMVERRLEELRMSAAEYLRRLIYADLGLIKKDV